MNFEEGRSYARKRNSRESAYPNVVSSNSASVTCYVRSWLKADMSESEQRRLLAQDRNEIS